MFSYTSTKNSQSTIQQNLIQQIQFLANEIFDDHTASITRTQQQQISLELSPTTSQDNFELKHHQTIHQEYPHVDQDICSKFENERHRSQNMRKQEMNYYTNVLKNQRPFQHMVVGKYDAEAKNIKKDENQQPTKRLTKSMLSAHNPIKQPGSFSNSYIPAKHIAASQVTPLPRSENPTDKEKQHATKEPEALNLSNLNKTNILLGILKQGKPIHNKTPQKKGKFSSSMASNYLSPYSTRGMKENPKSYMQRSNSQTKKPKQTVEIQYIKKRINQNIQPQISYRKQKTENQRLKNPKLSNIKSKYKQTKPLMHQYKSYAEEHIYKKMREEMTVWEEKKKQYEMFSNEEIENNWQEFISGEERFLEHKKQWRASKRLEKMEMEHLECTGSPMKNIVFNGRGSQFIVTPPKMTPQDFVKKYKRQKQKLKEKLQTNEVSNFMQRSYEDSKKYGKQIFDSVWGSSQSKQDIEATYMQGFSTINEAQSEEKKISKLLISQSSQKNKHQNFFISVGKQSHKSNSFKKKYEKANSKSNNKLTKSSIYEDKPKSSQKSSSRQPKTSNRKQDNSQRKQAVNSLSPFIKKSNYFSKEQHNNTKEFNPRKHNLPEFNEQITNCKQRSISKKRQKSTKKISELLNPKYFKSINELQQYSSNSRSHQRKQHMKRTFESGREQNLSPTELIKIQGNDSRKIKNQKLNQNHSRKGVITGFDHKLMNKIIGDLEQMRCEIQENKKKRKYRIQNYRNFSNVRGGKDDEEGNLATGSFVYEVKEEEQEYDGKQHQLNVQRRNNHFKHQPSHSLNPSFKTYHNHSRSVSPIQQQDSIINESHNLSISVIHQTNDQAKNISISQFSNNTPNSNIILVKSRHEVQFILEDR